MCAYDLDSTIHFCRVPQSKQILTARKRYGSKILSDPFANKMQPTTKDTSQVKSHNVLKFSFLYEIEDTNIATIAMM